MASSSPLLSSPVGPAEVRIRVTHHEQDKDTDSSLENTPHEENPAIQVHHTSCWRQLRSKFHFSAKQRCIKNLTFHSMSTFMVFTTFLTFQSIDSTLNSQGGLGVFSFMVIYTGLIISCVLAPCVVQAMGCKETMMLSFIAQLVFCLAHFYPTFYTMIPSSLILGLTLGPFWTAQGVYLVSLAAQYSRITGQEYNNIVGRFYGVFNFFYLSSQKFGNLLESLVLGRHATKPHVIQGNFTGRMASLTPALEVHCGAEYCSYRDNSTGPSLSDRGSFLVYVLIALYAASIIIGIIGKAGLTDTIDTSHRGTEHAGPQTAQDQPQSRMSDVTESLSVHCYKQMYLLVPLFFYNGLQQGFIFGDYTKSFVACELGLGMIGFVMVVYGYADALSSLLFGCLEKYTGRIALFTTAGVIQTSLVIFMQVWKPGTGGMWVLFLVPALWGIGDAVWQTTTSAMVGVLFYDKRESAFACFRLWQAAGLATAFANSHVLCTWAKLYVILAVMLIALLSYYMQEIGSRKRNTRDGYQTL